MTRIAAHNVLTYNSTFVLNTLQKRERYSQSILKSGFNPILSVVTTKKALESRKLDHL